MTIRLSAALAALVAIAAAPGPAAALSCLRPDPVATFQSAAESSDSYAVLYGSFDFDGSLMPGFDNEQQLEEIAPIVAEFTGRALGPDGFTIRYETELWLQPSCAGPWCGGMQPSDNVMAFVRDRGDGSYELELGACPYWVFFDPTQAERDHMQACLNGAQACQPSDG